MNDYHAARSAWESFYVIVGSSGGALIGLQFVVITLIADRHRYATGGGLSAFGTPTVVHLSGALVVAAIMSAPWRSLGPPSLAIASCGVAGLVYGVIVIRRAHGQTDYEPVWQDWVWHMALPFCAYAALGVAGFWLRAHVEGALVAIGAAALALLLVGIHNAWDTVTHIVMTSEREEKGAGSRE